MKTLMKIVMAASVLVLVGCGGGGSSQGEGVNNGLSKEYSGIIEKAILSEDNSVKFIRAVNYLENLDLSDLPSDDTDVDMYSGVSVDNHINQNSGLGYRIVIYDDYKYKSYARVTGKTRVDIDSIKVSGQIATIKMRTAFDLSVKTPNDLLTYKMSADVTMQTDGYEERIINILITKYYIYDKKYDEEIALTHISAKNKSGRLYVGSEGYIDFSGKDSQYRLEGGNNTRLELGFSPEKAIYETQYRDPVDPSVSEEREPYQEKIYEPKEGQGMIENSLNGAKKSDLYFAQYQVSEFEPPKFYESYGESQLLGYAFYTWHTHYRLLNQDTDNMQIKMEWLVNGEKVNTPIMQELPFGYYGENDTVEVMLTVSNGDMDFVITQKADYNNFGVSSGNYEYPKDTFEIEYRTNSLEFDLDLLAHEYFEDIDLEQCSFSWDVGFGVTHTSNPTDYTIINSTDYEKTPTIKATRYGDLYEPLYLKIYTKTELKVVRFNLVLSRGSSGLGGLKREDIIASIEEANTTNNYGYVATNKVEHYDLDFNGLDDIIYTSETYNGAFLNVSYQNTKRVFVNEKIAIGGGMYLGDFNGDGTKEALMFGSTEHGSELVSLEKGNMHITKEILLSSDMNLLDIKAVADMNDDGQDDLIISDNQEDKLYVYEDMDDLSQKYLVGSSCMGILGITDIDGDGLKDIVCKPQKSSTHVYGTDYFSSGLVIKYFIQNINKTFTLATQEYILVKDGSFSEASQTRVSGATLIGDNKVAINVEDSDGEQLYVFTLAGNNMSLLSKTPLNGSDIDTFFKPVDINGDGKEDLLSITSGAGSLSVILQKEDDTFDSNYLFSLGTYNQLTDRFIYNAFIDDIDHDGSLEIITVNGENKFSYINLK